MWSPEGGRARDVDSEPSTLGSFPQPGAWTGLWGAVEGGGQSPPYPVATPACSSGGLCAARTTTWAGGMRSEGWGPAGRGAQTGWGGGGPFKERACDHGGASICRLPADQA